MLILVLNSGSSSLKYKLYHMENESVLAAGNVERIGNVNGEAVINHKIAEDSIQTQQKIDTHNEALKSVLNFLTDPNKGVLKSLDEIKAVGHRVVHGGEIFSEAVIITEQELIDIESLKELAPLHMPPNIMGIKACKELMPNTPQIAVFDTAFHQTMPRKSFLYALPYEYYEKYRIRRYGFHGTSHRYVSKRAAKTLGKPFNELKIITLHLGNGSSISAIKDGKVVDTSMGFTPLEGVIMGTRCGDLDPAILPFLQNNLNKTPVEIDNILNKNSGLLGMTGMSDMRDIQKARREGNKRAEDVYGMLIHRLVKYVGAYTAVLGGLDLLIFTAGIGENDALIREDVCKQIAHLGIDFDYEANEGLRGKEAVISKPNSQTIVMVVPTNEELLIARDSYELVKNC